MATISIDYAAAINHAKELQTAAGYCETAARVLAEMISEMETRWVGLAASAANAQLSDLKKKISDAQAEFASVASDITRVANAIKEADEKAAAAAEALKLC